MDKKRPDQEELYLLALQCIFFALKNERLKKDLFNNISKLKDIEVPETSNEYSSISNSENNNVSTGGGSKVPIKQRTHSSTNLLNQPVRVTRVTSSVNTANMLKQGIRLSNLQILISLYAFITSEIPVPGLILTLVHILTNICQQFNGTEMFLAELNRVQRVNKRGGFLGNFSLAQSLSEESLRLALRGNSSQINQECLYLLPLLSPLKQIDASYLVFFFFLLFSFLFFLSSPFPLSSSSLLPSSLFSFPSSLISLLLSVFFLFYFARSFSVPLIIFLVEGCLFYAIFQCPSLYTSILALPCFE